MILYKAYKLLEFPVEKSVAKSTRFAPVLFIISRLLLAACLLAFLCVRHYETARLRQLRTVGSGAGTVSALQTYAGAESVARNDKFVGGDLVGELTNPMVDSGRAFDGTVTLTAPTGHTKMYTVFMGFHGEAVIELPHGKLVVIDPPAKCNLVNRWQISPACWQGMI